MKRSSLMRLAMIVAGSAGFLALIGAWLAGEGGSFAGLSQGHLFFDAIALELVSVSAGVCALIYIKREQMGGSLL